MMHSGGLTFEKRRAGAVWEHKGQVEHVCSRTCAAAFERGQAEPWSRRGSCSRICQLPIPGAKQESTAGMRPGPAPVKPCGYMPQGARRENVQCWGELPAGEGSHETDR